METVEHIAKYLATHQVDTWYAPRDLPPGSARSETIARAIRSSDALVLLFDSSADTRRRTKREIELADDADIPIRWLRLEDVEPAQYWHEPRDMGLLEWLDKRDESLARLVWSLPKSEPEPAPDVVDLQGLGDETQRQARLKLVLAEATGLDTETLPGGAVVTFRSGGIVSIQRVSLSAGDGHVHLVVTAAELSAQYQRVYTDASKVDSLAALADNPGWEVNANFHIAYWRAAPHKRWYPQRHLPGTTYVQRWVEDVRAQRAALRNREQIEDPSFGQWLVDRGYASRDELAGLADWVANQPTDKFHIRPGIEIKRTWTLAEAGAKDGAGHFVAEVRGAVDQVLAALQEPSLDDVGGR